MNTILILTILIVAVALAFDFINGFHDTANAIATSVSTKALKPRHAIRLAAVMNFAGAMAFTGVAKTITKDIVDPFSLENGTIVLLCSTGSHYLESHYVVLRILKQFLPCTYRFCCRGCNCSSRCYCIELHRFYKNN